MKPGSAALTSFLTALGLFSTISSAGSQNTFEHDFNTDPALAGMELRRSARWRTFGSHDGSGYISLTDAASNQSGKLLLPDFSGPAGIDGFTATLRVRIGGGTCCGGPGLWIPAEGMSFSFAAPSDPAVAALDGTGWLPGGPQEGTGTGLSICLDTFDNGGGEGPAIEVKLDGKTIAAAPSNPRTGDGWATVELIVEPCGMLTLIYNGGTVFNALPIGFMPPLGRFLFGARTSDGNDNHWIDDVTITTTAYTGPHPRVVSKYPASTREVPLDRPIQFTIEERSDPVDGGSIRLTLDGIRVPATVSTTNVQGFTQHIVEYSSDLLFTPFLHSAILSYTSASGHACQVTNKFRTPSFPMLFIEAEDFNFSDAEGINPGQHVNFGDPDGSLKDKSATVGIDANDDLGIGDAICCDPYRALSHVEAAGTNVDIAGRGDRVIEQDWVVGWTAAGEWANYTRTFPNAAYLIYVRALASTETVAELGEVVSDPTQPNQSVRRIGTFVIPAAAAPENFTYAPLRDATGQPVVVRLSGIKTLRYTVLNGDHDYNFLAFVAEPPCVSVGPPDFFSPSPNATTDGTMPLVHGEFYNSCYTTISIIGLSINGADVTTDTQIILRTDGGAFSYQVLPPDFPPNSAVNVALSLLHVSFGTRTTNILRWTFYVGPITPDTLFIEAEDFNFSDADSVNPGQHINFGAPDGSLLNREGTVGIDYYDSENNDAEPGSSIYRPDTGVEAAKGGLGGGNDSANRGARDITVNWIVGWMTSGEWMNYTREFPSPARRYHIYARVASGFCTEQAQLDLVTSDPSQPDQTTRKLGVFDSPSSGGWEVFHTIPLRTDLGAVAAIKLGGKQTIRFTATSGCMDLNWLAFVPAPPGRSQIASVGPGLNREWPNPYAPLVYATIHHGDAPVILSTVRLTLDGVAQTTNATITETDAEATIALRLSGDEGALHTAVVEWDDGLGLQSHVWTFREGPRYAVDHLFIEAEDFNTGGGQYLPSNPALAHEFNDKGLYLGRSAVPEVDFHDSGNLEENNYRHDELNIGMIPLDDANRNGSGERPGFEIVPDYKIGWTDAAGDWYNYTRTFPPGNYRVWARLAYGETAVTMGGQLDLVTSDRTRSNQTLVTLGEFTAPASGNWEAFQFVPLMAGGDKPVWVRLGGEQTLRYSVKRAGGDINYFMFVRQIPCPQNIQANTDAGQCSAALNFAVAGNISCTPPSGAAFPVGVTEVFCVGDGQECSFTVTIEEREPPTIAVRAAANPAGQIKAKSADDGRAFYEILASDNCGTAPLIFIKDAASNFVAGPYHSGARLKLVPNSGSNQINKGPNGLAAHINIAGVAHVYATDSAGNVSQPIVVSK